MQYDTGEGPCLDTLYPTTHRAAERHGSGDPVPRLTARVVQLEIGSMLSFQIYVEQDRLGVLNL